MNIHFSQYNHIALIVHLFVLKINRMSQKTFGYILNFWVYSVLYTCSVYLSYGQRPRYNDFLRIISRVLGKCNYHRVRV
jgi:hypothetical protein